MRTATITMALLLAATTALGQAPSVTHTGSFSSGLLYPARLAPDGGGGTFATDPPNGMVVHFDAAGLVVGTYAIAEGPLGVAVHPDGRVIVSREDGQIGLYDPAFVLLGTVDPSPYAFGEPNDLVFDAVGSELYAVDGGTNQVMVFSETAPNTFTLVRMWGMTGGALSEFHTPQAIAMDPFLGYVVVTDTDNYRVQVFNTVGTLLLKFGHRTLYTAGGDTAWFPRSQGVAFDGCGNIYVVDAMMGTVRAFDITGQELDPTNTPILNFGSGPGELRGPCDIVIDNLGNMFIASTNNGAVEVYDVACVVPLSTVASVVTAERPRSLKQEIPWSRRDSETARQRSRVYPPAPDNPAEIAQAIFENTYCKDLDLNADGFVDETDLEISVAAFGAGTIQDFHAGSVAAHPSLDAPHILDLADRCGRCHSMDGAPDGGMLTSAGQENLCLSCHSAGKIANDKPITVEESKNNHPWGIAADSGHSTGPAPDSDLALHLDNGDIRCATCHDPHNSAEGPEYLRLPSSSDNPISLCGECHEEYDEWLNAGHSDETADPFSHYDWTQSNRASCRQCHSGNGFIDFAAGLPSTEQSGEFRVHDCLVCHATHGASQDGELLRLYGEVTLPGGLVVDRGESANCMSCHNGRYEPNTGHSTPHYLLGGVMLEGINGIDFGAVIENSPHTVLAECVDCHMADSPAAGDGAGKVGGHTFNMTVHDSEASDNGFENFENACNSTACHGTLGGIVAAAPDPAVSGFDRTAFGDYDGNGLIEGVQTEVQGLMDLVFGEIATAGGVFLGHYPYWDFSGVVDVPPGFLQTVKDAVWNYEYVDNDASLGVHNTSYAVGLLQVTYRELTGFDIPDAFLRYDAPPLLVSGTHAAITSVNGGLPVEPGGAFTVDFTIEDDDGFPIAIGDLNRLQLYVSGPTGNYQRVIPSDSDPTHFVQNLDESYTYTAVGLFPTVYSAPLNDSLDITEGEMTGAPLLDGTYTVLIETRRVFGSIRKAGDATADFVVANDPLLPPALDSRQFVLQDSCNACHLDLQVHGANRFSVTGCVVCHTAGAEDKITAVPSTPGRTIMFKRMIHKIHSGHDMRNVEATANGLDPFRYEVIGYGSSVHDFSDVGFPVLPDGVTGCDACHGGAAQEAEIATNITRENCNACHDDMDFVTGTILDQAHPSVADGLLAEADLSDPAYRVVPGISPLEPLGISHVLSGDTTCANCHAVGMSADAVAAHLHSTDPTSEGTGLTVQILGVAGMTGGGGTYFQAGDVPEITFKLTDVGNDPLAVPAVADSTVVDRMYFMVVGPTTLYQQIIPDQRAINNGAVSVAPANWIDNLDGTYTYVMTAGFPTDYPAQENTIGEAPADQIFPYEEGWGQQYDAGGRALDTGSYSVMAWGRRRTSVGATEPMITDVFDVPFGANDPIVPWPATVNRDKCNTCHGVLAFHGNQRENVQLCAGCHTAGGQDAGTTNGIDLRRMIHKLHNAKNLTNLPYELNGHSGIEDFSHLVITSMPGEAAECEVCHATDAWKAPPVRSNMRTWMTACTSCHDSATTATHVQAATAEGSFGETCTSCHGAGAAWSVEKVHMTP